MPRQKERTPALRDELLRAALDVLADVGPHGLQARSVAVAAGTSTAALYELFGDKAGLIRALFSEGFGRLRADIDAAPTSDDLRADVVALFDAARAFARRHPHLFDVMFARPFSEFDPNDDDRRAGAGVYRAVVDRVARWLQAMGSPVDPVDAAHALVATYRGLAASELAGTLGTSATSIDRRWRLSIGAVLDGLARAEAV